MVTSGDALMVTSGDALRLWLKFRDAGGGRVADVTGVLGVIMIGMCF
jgi:hypothetical protein